MHWSSSGTLQPISVYKCFFTELSSNRSAFESNSAWASHFSWWIHQFGYQVGVPLDTVFGKRLSPLSACVHGTKKWLENFNPRRMFRSSSCLVSFAIASRPLKNLVGENESKSWGFFFGLVHSLEFHFHLQVLCEDKRSCHFGDFLTAEFELCVKPESWKIKIEMSVPRDWSLCVPPLGMQDHMLP